MTRSSATASSPWATDYSSVTLLPAVTEDESLVADYLSQYFVDAKDFKPWDT